MKKVFITKSFSVFYILSFLLILTSCSITTDFVKKPLNEDAEKDKFIQKFTQSTNLHMVTAKSRKKDVKTNPDDLKGTKAALVSVSFRVITDFSVSTTHALYTANGIADVIKRQFSEKAKFTFIPDEEIVSNSDYQAMRFESKKEKTGISAKASANNLVFIPLSSYWYFPNKTADALKPMINSLGVDYVVTARVDVYFEPKGRNLTPYIQRINFDILGTDQVVWSFGVPRQRPFDNYVEYKGIKCKSAKLKTDFFGNQSTAETQVILDGIIEAFDKTMDIALYKYNRDKSR